MAVLDAEDPYRLTAVRTQVGLMLDEFETWDVCVKSYEQEMAKAEGASPRAVKELIQTSQSQFTQFEEKEAVAIEVRWRAEGRGYRVLHPRIVSLLGKRQYLDSALQCWSLGWVQIVRDEQFPDRMHWQLQVPGMDTFWLTPNKPADDCPGPFEALESFVLVGRNQSRSRRGVRLNWIELYKVLRAQWDVSETDSVSPLCKSIAQALDKNGLVAQWYEMAGMSVDPRTDREIYAQPIYRDLADIAKDYCKSISC